MAKNLQSKLKPGDKVTIFDINREAMEALGTEMKAASNGAAVELAASAFDASKDAVRFRPLIEPPCSPCLCRPSVVFVMITIVLSMIQARPARM